MRTCRDLALRATAARWARRYWASRVLYGIGIQFDALIDLTAEGLRASFPDFAPPDGLAAIGKDRRIRRGFAEPAASYAARLKRWIPDRKTKGNPYTLMRQLRGYLTGYDVRFRVVNNAGAWHTLFHDGTTDFYVNDNWNWDGSTDPWSRYWVIIYPPTALWNGDGLWGQGAGTWGDGGVWGLNATHDQGKSIQAIINEWNPPHAQCAGIIVTWDMFAFDPRSGGTAFYPDGTWWRAGKDDAGSYVQTRPNIYRFAGAV